MFRRSRSPLPLKSAAEWLKTRVVPDPVRVRRLVFGLVVALAVFSLLEGVARFAFGPPTPPLVARMPDGNEQLTDINGDTLTLHYMQRSASLPIGLDDETPRVVWLGGSSLNGGTVGPAELQAASLMSDILPINSLNLAAPGLDAGHLALLVPTVLELQPAAVVIYSGHNDIGNTTFKDKYSDARSVRLAQIRGLLSQSRIFQLLEMKVRRPDVLEVEPYGVDRDQMTPMTPAKRVVLANRFEERLRAVVGQLRRADIPVLLCTVVSNPASVSMDRDCLQSLKEARSMSTPDSSVQHLGLETLRRMRDQNPDCHPAQLLYARMLADTGDGQEGRALLDELRENDPTPVRADAHTDASIKRVARQEGAQLVDVRMAFREAGGGLEPPVWFNDQVHFSPQGQQMLARLIGPVLAEELDLPVPVLPLPELGRVSFSGCVGMFCR